MADNAEQAGSSVGNDGNDVNATAIATGATAAATAMETTATASTATTSNEAAPLAFGLAGTSSTSAAGNALPTSVTQWFNAASTNAHFGNSFEQSVPFNAADTDGELAEQFQISFGPSDSLSVGQQRTFHDLDEVEATLRRTAAEHLARTNFERSVLPERLCGAFSSLRVAASTHMPAMDSTPVNNNEVLHQEETAANHSSLHCRCPHRCSFFIPEPPLTESTTPAPEEARGDMGEHFRFFHHRVDAPGMRRRENYSESEESSEPESTESRPAMVLRRGNSVSDLSQCSSSGVESEPDEAELELREWTV